jgi:hypothetical protein
VIQCWRRFARGCVIAGVALVLQSPLTIAADGGRQLWMSRYDGPVSGIDYGRAVTVSPDGSRGGTRVFVTGESPGAGTDDDVATVAYAA